LNDRADSLRALGRLDEAAADYQGSIEQNPKQIDAYIGLAIIHSKQDKDHEAERCYDQMVAADPDSALVYVRRAEHLRNRGKFDASLADCDRAVGLDAKSPLPNLVRESVHASRGQPAAAIAAAKRWLESGERIDGNANYAAACVFSLAARAFASESTAGDAADQATAAADQAAALLTEAWEKGFLDLSYQQYNRVADDPAIAPILTHPNVQRLLPR
jgi:tetratricopeptide (TPR) repeat protein